VGDILNVEVLTDAKTASPWSDLFSDWTTPGDSASVRGWLDTQVVIRPTYAHPQGGRIWIELRSM
jgi:hypothetical protein